MRFSLKSQGGGYQYLSRAAVNGAITVFSNMDTPLLLHGQYTAFCHSPQLFGQIFSFAQLVVSSKAKVLKFYILNHHLAQNQKGNELTNKTRVNTFTPRPRANITSLMLSIFIYGLNNIYFEKKTFQQKCENSLTTK